MQNISAFYFDSNDLARRLRESGGSAGFRSAAPFPHVVLDDFLPEEVMRLLIAEFPGEDDIEWQSWGPGRTGPSGSVKANKLGQSDERFFPPFTRHFMSQLLSSTFVSFIEAVSGIEGLIVDPSYNGCGLHTTGPGGRLMIHTDVNRHPHSVNRLHQVLNLIIFLNEDWKEEYEGHLELWTGDRRPCRRILPIANRAVLFETGTRSFHGHPKPLACPGSRRRNSLAVYYYSVDRAPSQEYDGMQQYSPHWVPTSDADWRWATELGMRAEEMTLQISGRKVSLPSHFLPVQVGNLSRGDQVHLTVVHESLLSAKAHTALRQGRIAAMFDAEPNNAGLKCVVGYFSGSDDASITDTDSVLLACGRDDGALYIESPETGRGIFWCYFDRLERMLPDLTR